MTEQFSFDDFMPSERTIAGFTADQLETVAKEAARRGMPRLQAWALIEHAEALRQNRFIEIEIPEVPHPELLVIAALQRLKRGHQR